MTLHAISIPKWGLSMEEGTLASWLVAEGDTVKPGIELAEIETTKITNVLESQVAGTLRRHVAQPGDVRKVGGLIGVVADADEPDAEIDAFIGACEAQFAVAAALEPAAPEPQILEIGGKPLCYLKAAAQSPVAATPMLLLHGFGGDHLNWQFNQSALAEQRDVYALDLPGHGRSTKDVAEASFASLAATVFAWIEAMGLPKIHVVGHSMGAGVALALALTQPERVQSLVAICGAGFGGKLNPAYVEGFIAAQNRKQLKPVVALLFPDPELATREMLDDLSAYKRIDGVAEALRQLSDGALSASSLDALAAERPALRMPSLAIHGGKDQVMQAPASLDTDAVLLPSAGHMPHLEAAADINARVAAFVVLHD